MSHQPSPGPSHHAHASTANSGRHKAQKHMAPSVLAGMEDAKYEAKYRELKKKVKEIELDNDALLFKVNLAKRNIQRMRLERAILYERIAALPPSPRPQPAHGLPPVNAPPPVPHHATHGHPAQYDDSRERELDEYLRAHPNANIRVVPGPDGLPIPVERIDPPVSSTQWRRSSAANNDRTLPPLPTLQSAAYDARPPANSHGHAHGHSHAHGHAHHHHEARPRPSSSHSQTSRPSSPPPPIYAQHPAPPAQVQLAHSHNSAPPYPTQPSSPTSSRSTSHGAGRHHHHQRVGPGANFNLSEWERQREVRAVEREIDAERDREMEARRLARVHSPPYDVRRRSVDEGATTAYASGAGRGGFAPGSRGDTPGSAAGSRGEGEPSFRRSPRPPQDTFDGGPRLPYQEASRPPPETRKRSRSELERDSGSPATAEGQLLVAAGNARAAGFVANERDRGAKRVHPDGESSENQGRSSGEGEPMDAD